MDEGDWLCLQCGTYYYTGLYLRSHNDRPPEQGTTPSHQGKGIASQRLVEGFAEPGATSLIMVGTLKPVDVNGQGYTSMAQVPGPGPMTLK